MKHQSPVNMHELEKHTQDAVKTSALSKSANDNTVVANDNDTVVSQPSFAQKYLPQWAQDGMNSFNRKVARVRQAALVASPAWLVNNTSNIFGALHVATEMLMIKSGMKGAKLIDHPEKLSNWIVEPAQKIFKDFVPQGDYSPWALFHGNPFKNAKEYIMDSHASTLREIERRAPNLAEMGKELKVGNPWQTRTTGTGLIIWSLSTVIPERKESDEEIERMAKMRTLHPVKYVGERLKQAVYFPQWNTHKREMLGLGYLGIGLFSALGSWRNRGELVPELLKLREEELNTIKSECKLEEKKILKSESMGEALKSIRNMYKDKELQIVKEQLENYVGEVRGALKESKPVATAVLDNVKLIEKALKKGLLLTQGYKFNLSYFATAVVSFLGGLPLLFALDERKAYSTYGSMVVLRLPLLPSSLGSKIKAKEQGWQYYTAGKLTFQAEDMAFSAIGGATKKKRADGTYEIIDHDALKKKAIFEAKEERLERREERIEAEKVELAGEPRTRIGSASKPERAMPERAVAHEKRVEAAI